jgi:hypothetical protein
MFRGSTLPSLPCGRTTSCIESDPPGFILRRHFQQLSRIDGTLAGRRLAVFSILTRATLFRNDVCAKRWRRAHLKSDWGRQYFHSQCGVGRAPAVKRLNHVLCYLNSRWYHATELSVHPLEGGARSTE